MFDRPEILDRLSDLLQALERIPKRCSSINSPEDFLVDDMGQEHLDSICMVLVAAGEAFRWLDAKTERKFLSRYQQIPWRDVIAVRNVIAHGYFDVDTEQVFSICKKDIPELIEVVRMMIRDLQAD
ncbi:MAG TPA: DUF86 domain-containing protein [bacterium]|nr:DUF86 domain-containing protein [bacterium]